MRIGLLFVAAEVGAARLHIIMTRRAAKVTGLLAAGGAMLVFIGVDSVAKSKKQLHLSGEIPYRRGGGATG
jgi:hypothetical protein